MAEPIEGATKLVENKWDLRIQRAESLAEDDACPAIELLRFYAHVAKQQRRVYETLHPEIIGIDESPSIDRLKDRANLEHLIPKIVELFFAVRMHGPDRLAARANELVHSPEERVRNVLHGYWHKDQDELDRFFSRAIIQAAAERLGEMAQIAPDQNTNFCPFCGSNPSVAIERGEAGHFFVCSLCSVEWRFPRTVCQNCGTDGLSHHSIARMPQIKVEGCNTCHSYIKCVDMMQLPSAVPVVDEIASIPLTLWAAEKGYHKVTDNMMGM